MKQPDMENKFYRELSRRLAEEGISTDQPGEKGLPVLHDSRPAVFISASGLAYMSGEGGEEERELYHKGGLRGARGTRSRRATGFQEAAGNAGSGSQQGSGGIWQGGTQRAGRGSGTAGSLEGFTDFAALGRLCMGQDGIHSEAPEMEML